MPLGEQWGHVPDGHRGGNGPWGRGDGAERPLPLEQSFAVQRNEAGAGRDCEVEGFNET